MISELRNQPAFTIVEILVVMGIIAVIAGMAVVGISITQRATRDESRKVTASEIVAEINDQFRLSGRYPNDSDIQWSSTLVEIGDGSVALQGAESYSDSTTDANSTRYEYIKDTSGFILCTLLEGGAWHKLGNGLAQCPAL